MLAYEFEADVVEGVIKVPDAYLGRVTPHLKVILMCDENEATANFKSGESVVDFSQFHISSFEGVDSVA